MMRQNPPGADYMFVCRQGVKYAACVRVWLHERVRLLIACAGGEGHEFNQATRHSFQKGCKLSHTHTQTHINRYTHMFNSVANLRIEGWKSGLKVV